jgi:hypothetical protein
MSFGPQPTVLSRAPLRPYGTFATFRYSPDGDDKGGDTGDDKSKEGADKGEKKNEPTEAEKLAELLKAERVKWEADAAAKAKKSEDAAAKKKAEEEGKFKELADAAEKRANEAEAKALNAERSTLIDDAFTDVVSESKDGVTLKALREWVKPKVLAGLTAETDADEVRKSAKSLAEQYVKDVGAAKPKGSGVPPALPRTPNRANPNNPDARSPRTPNGNRIVTPSSRF